MSAPSKVAIVGAGLIGTSLGLALKRLPRPPQVVAFDLDQQRVRLPPTSRALDRVEPGLLEAVDGADLVIVATPVRSVEVTLREIGNRLAEGAVVTDTASTKARVVEWSRRWLPQRVGFVGGHPMTGKMTANVDGPDASLFAGQTYCLTPTADVPAQVVDRVVWLVESVGAVPFFLDAEEHDAIVASVSHLPYLLSAALMGALAGDEAWREMRSLAAGGLLAATSLADGDARMFADICLTNQEHIVQAMDRYLAHLRELRDEIAKGDEQIVRRFDDARRARLEWVEGRGATESGLSEEDLKPSSPFLGGRLSDLLRGKLARD